MRRAACTLFGLVWRVTTATACAAAALPETPLVQAHYTRISSAAEISAHLDALVAASPLARKEILGASVEQRPLEALVLASQTHRAHATPRPVLMLIGSQHGAAEPAGGEAMLSLAHALIAGDLRAVLDDLDVVLLPDANPDGRDHGRRSNARHVNLNTDFVLLSQPESQALVVALDRFRPLAVLDVHESAVLKRKTLAREGYLTDFDAQFEAANNPAMPHALREYGLETLLPALIAAVSAGGLPAQRYMGEITSLDQPITNGGPTLRNFRNLAGLHGAASFLVETKLDSRADAFASYRNIEVRVARSLACQRAFVELMQARREPLLAQVVAARVAAQKEALTLHAAYVADPDHPRVEVVLRRLATRAQERLSFADHRRLVGSDSIAMPATYVVPQPSDQLRALLEHHGIHYERQSLALELPVMADSFSAPQGATGRVELQSSSARFLTTEAGALIVDLVQPRGRLVPLLLDPRSISSVFRLPEFAAQLIPGREFGVYRVHKGVLRSAPAAE